MTADDLTRLRAVAEAATPGPWEQEPDTMAGRVWVRTAWNSDLEPNTMGKFFQWRRLFAVRTYRESHAKTPEQVYQQRVADAEFIATFDPPMVAALIDRVERAERGYDGATAAVAGALFQRDKARSELAALRAAVAGLADDMGSIASGVETTLVAGVRFGKLRDVHRQLRALLAEGADDGQ